MFFLLQVQAQGRRLGIRGTPALMLVALKLVEKASHTLNLGLRHGTPVSG